MQTDAPHIIIVDDDREIRDLLARFLVKHGLRITVAEDGKALRRLLEAGRADLIVLDLMMPGEDGLSLCRWLQAEHLIPVIMLTAMGEETDRIVGLEMGADDYVAKPFNPRELLARIRAVLRRVSAMPPQPAGAAPVPEAVETSHLVYLFEGRRLKPASRELFDKDGVITPLSAGEFDLLVAFVEHPRRVLTRDQLLDLTKGRVATVFDRSIDVQLSRLRRKVESDPKDPTLIKTVRGGGYIFTSAVEKVEARG